MKEYKLIRNIEYTNFFQVFFLSSIVTIVLIRLYLQLTGFPQIGTGEFHIAHTLWGGLCMVLSIFGLMTFLNSDLRLLWAIGGGVGFGTFIDEIGKFITNDNDYFYEPTFSIIYIIFIVFYFLYKSINRTKQFSKEEYLINSIEKLKEVVIKDLDKEEQQQALLYLEKSDPKDVTTKFLQQLFSELRDIPEQKVGLYGKLRNILSSYYHYFITHPRLLTIFSIMFLMRSLVYIIYGLFLTRVVVLYWDMMVQKNIADVFLEFGQLAALLIQAVLTVAGVIYMKVERKRAYQSFKYALLISILILQVFNFYTNPLVALVSTIIDLFLLSILQYMITKEHQDHNQKLRILK